MKIYPFLSLAVSLSQLCTAHDLYLLPDAFRVHPGTAVTIRIHNGDSFPESEVPPVLARLKSAQLAGRAGVSPVKGLQVSGKEVIGQVAVPGGSGRAAT